MALSKDEQRFKIGLNSSNYGQPKIDHKTLYLFENILEKLPTSPYNSLDRRNRSVNDFFKNQKGKRINNNGFSKFSINNEEFNLTLKNQNKILSMAAPNLTKTNSKSQLSDFKLSGVLRESFLKHTNGYGSQEILNASENNHVINKFSDVDHQMKVSILEKTNNFELKSDIKNSNKELPEKTFQKFFLKSSGKNYATANRNSAKRIDHDSKENCCQNEDFNQQQLSNETKKATGMEMCKIKARSDCEKNLSIVKKNKENHPFSSSNKNNKLKENDPSKINFSESKNIQEYKVNSETLSELNINIKQYNWEEALSIVNKILFQRPSIEYQIIKSKLLIKLGQAKEALCELNYILNKNPKNIKVN